MPATRRLTVVAGATRAVTILLAAVLCSVGGRAAIAAPPAEGAAAQAAEERWRGAIDLSAVGQGELEFFVTFSRAGAEVTATLSIPAQGVHGAPLQAVHYDEQRIAFTLATQPPAVFEARRTGDRAEGTLTQGAQLPIRMRRLAEEEPGGDRRPQTPRPPFPYRQLPFRVQRPGFALAGTLTLPQGAGPHPAVLLLTGSGPQDRDETIFGHRPFLVLADALTRAGIAVLRLDDRGVGSSGGAFAEATSEEFVEDALAAVDALAGVDEIDGDRIGLIGHSEGGLVAAFAAARSARIAALVLLAAPGVPGRSLMPQQLAAIERAAGLDEQTVAAHVRAQEALFDLVLAGAAEEEIRSAAERLVDLQLQATGGADPARREEAVQQALRQVGSPWFRRFLVLDPAEALRRVRCPVLALGGTLDLQVPAAANLDAIAAALAAAGNEAVTTRRLEGLNHLFQHANTGLVDEYGEIEETIAPEVLTLIADWLRERWGLRSPAGERDLVP